jgi:hypothetical protein
MKTRLGQARLFIKSFQDLLGETDPIFSEAKSYWFHGTAFLK